MFQNCKGLTSIPENLLHTTTLNSGCYVNMFYGCTSLTSIPENFLPATTLANSCYVNMFYGCTGLINIGSINAYWFSTKTAQTAMFSGCTAITTPIIYSDIPQGWK
jgi:hypothetical protein